MNKNKYVCAWCKETHQKADSWDPVPEAKENFGEDFDCEKDGVLVCDDCYKKVLEAFPGGIPKTEEELNEQLKRTSRPE